MNAKDIVNDMLSQDHFSHWLGIEVRSVGEGTCVATMEIREDMLNGFGIAHGGISFSFADSVFAFASNGRGRHAFSVNTTIKHLKKIQLGDQLVATARETHRGPKIASYQIKVENQRQELVAIFDGMVYISSKKWERADID